MNSPEQSSQNKSQEQKSFELAILEQSKARYLKLAGIVKNFSGVDRYMMIEKIGEFDDLIRSKGFIGREFEMWHLIAGSTPEGEYPHFDFPEPYSVEKFLVNLESEIEELGEKKEKEKLLGEEK